VYGTGSWMTDTITWSLAAAPSFVGMIPANKFSLGAASAVPWTATGGNWAGSLIGDAQVAGSQAWDTVPTLTAFPGVNDIPWQPVFVSSAAIPSALEPAYRGRFRAYAYMRVIAPSSAALPYPSMGVFPFQALLDAVPVNNQWQSLASANQLASVYAGIPSGWANLKLNPGYATYLDPSPNYGIFDLGEINLPPAGSGYQQGLLLRLWMIPASGLGSAMQPAIGSTSMPSVHVRFGGVQLIPVDGAAGVLTGGLAQPSISGWLDSLFSIPTIPIGSAYQAAFEMGRGFNDSFEAVAPSGAGQAVLDDLRSLHRGVAPRLGATTNQLVFMTGDRRWGSKDPVTQGTVGYSKASVSYRPLFNFLYGV
jgi:hypothetical protein